jgi:large subunit ribosomal protein L13
MNCYQAKAGELAHQWYVIDANEAVVGRLAAQIAPILMGKHRPTYTRHIDTGDYVIVTNVDKVVFTGNKWHQKFYQSYSGHPGGQKDEQAWKLFQRHPDRILKLAVGRMMPKSKLGRHMMSKLKLYSGSVHEHQAQSPIPLAAIYGRPSASGAIYAPKANHLKITGRSSGPEPSKNGSRVDRPCLVALRGAIDRSIQDDLGTDARSSSRAPITDVVKPKEWLHEYIRRVVAGMTEEVRLSTLDEAMAWKRQYNNRRLILLKKRRFEGLDQPESLELERLQDEARTYADFIEARQQSKSNATAVAPDYERDQESGVSKGEPASLRPEPGETSH